MTESRLYGATIAFECSKMKAKILELSKMALFQVDTLFIMEIECPNCGKSNFTEIRKFNLMFKTFMGVTEDAKSEVYLRPETAQRNVCKL